MKKNVVICGAVRSVDTTLIPDMDRISKALDDFNLKWLFIESDSNDATVNQLKQMMLEDSNIRAEFCGALESMMPNRTQRIAHARNLYTKIVKEEYPNVDYVVVADFDGLNSDINKEAVATSFKRKDWDIVTSNQGDIYYDIWCLRAKGWIEHDCWAHYRNLVSQGADHLVAFKYAIAPLLRNIPRDSDWLEVEGAHSGFLIFKPEAFVTGIHDPFTPDGKEACEIVAYNKMLHDAGYKFFINPAMINAESTNHSRWLLERRALVI